MARTTRSPAYDVRALWPELSERALVAVRLHPRRGTAVVERDSSLGGPIRWPRDEPWPDCDLEHVRYDGFGGPGTDLDCHYAAVLQVLRSDVPELAFREGTDAFHLLWCPNNHLSTYSVVCRAFWWRTDELEKGRQPPGPTVLVPGYVPAPCALHPERVEEFPAYGDLTEADRARIGAWEDKLDDPVYQWQLSTAPGTKVGGYPHWFQDPQWPRCPRGHDMSLLLTVSDHEFDGGTWQRWLPIEEEGLWQGPTDRRLQVQEPADLRLGMGSVYVFYCGTCPDWPIETVYQR